MLQVTGYPTLHEGVEYLKNYVVQAEARGERVIVFCEDRLTLLAEQSVCQALGGSFLTSVTTFARFLRYSGKILSKQGSIMAVGKLLADNSKRLKCLSFGRGAKNGAAAVYEMLSQLFASKVTEEMLLCEVAGDELLEDKLRDLSLLEGLYEEFLTKNGYVDENRYLSMLPDAIRQDKNIRGATVVFLGFSSFTAQALDGVRAACETANNVLGLLPAGNAEIYTQQAATAFKRTCEEYGEVKLSQLKIPTESTGAADVLREKLYEPEVFAEQYTAKKSDNRVQIKQAQDEEDELRFVCARIQKHILTGGRYSDIAVFLPDVKAYSLVLHKVFEEYKIPYFADVKKPLSAHPFAFFSLAILRAVSDGGTPASVARVLSSCYFGDDGQFRNYLAKFCNYRGGYKKEIKDGDILKGYDRERLISLRERLLTGMGIFSREMTGKDFCYAVRKLYTLFNVEEVTKTLANACEDELQREYLLNLEKSLEGVLSEAESLLGAAKFTASDFASLLEDGLTACEISLIPLGQDEVFVGDISQSRTLKNKIVFALGLTDAVPTRNEDTALLSDKEMQRLETLKIKIEPSVAQVNDRTRENVCLNVTSFEENLYLLYPAQTDDERTVSDIIRYTERIFSDTQDIEDLFIYNCTHPMPALKELLLQKEDYIEGYNSSRMRYTSLYAALQEQEELKERATRLFKGVTPVFFVAGGEKLFFASGEVSPTLLENYYTCPYRNFTSKGLKLQEREETAVMLTDAGTFVHSVLEETAKNIENLPNKEACGTFARDFAERLFTQPKFAPLRDTKAGQYSSERLCEESAQVALEMYRQIKNSNFKVAYTEYDCRLPEAGMRGKIDRVDECGDYVRIIDYKTGNIDDSPLSYYTGQKLQLQLYMSAVSAGKTPAGIYYFPASVRYAKEDEKPFRMLGFMNGDKEVIQNSDTTLSEGEKSDFFNAFLGENKSDKVMEEDDFRHFIAYSVLASRQGGSELKKGFIAPTPYEGACRYCAYKGMCAALGEAVVRKVEGQVKCKTVADIVRKETEGVK